MFQAIFVLLAIFLARAIGGSILVVIAIIMAAWWAGLACFASQPIGGAFKRERQYISQLREEQASVFGKYLIQGVFFGLYWPIFISKNAYLILIIGAAVIYYGVQYLHG
jgi:hypothetical protein